GEERERLARERSRRDRGRRVAEVGEELRRRLEADDPGPSLEAVGAEEEERRHTLHAPPLAERGGSRRAGRSGPRRDTGARRAGLRRGRRRTAAEEVARRGLGR